MRDVIDVQTPTLLTRIIRQSAIECGVTVKLLKCRARPKRYVEARRLAAYLCREYTRLSSTVIAKAMGRKDHTTVLHNAKVGQNMLLNNAAFAGRVSAVRARLGL